MHLGYAYGDVHCSEKPGYTWVTTACVRSYLCKTCSVHCVQRAALCITPALLARHVQIFLGDSVQTPTQTRSRKCVVKDSPVHWLFMPSCFAAVLRGIDMWPGRWDPQEHMHSESMREVPSCETRARVAFVCAHSACAAPETHREEARV